MDDEDQLLQKHSKESTKNDNDEIDRFFYEGSSLNLQEANKINTENQTQIIIIAGSSGSGKTTLLACIYDLFLQGGFRRFSFCGSLTLPGFEKRCYLSRISSGRGIADTERTIVSDKTEFLHLCVAGRKQLCNHYDILFTDISGENFRMIKDNSTECKKYTFFKRADHFVCLLDGTLLSERKYRQNSFTDSRMLLRSVIDNGMIDESTIVDFVFSKWDLIQPVRRTNDNSLFVDHISQKLKVEFENQVGEINFFRIASRPNKQKYYPFGFNLETLFFDFVTKTKKEYSPSQ